MSQACEKRIRHIVYDKDDLPYNGGEGQAENGFSDRSIFKQLLFLCTAHKAPASFPVSGLPEITEYLHTAFDIFVPKTEEKGKSNI